MFFTIAGISEAAVHPRFQSKGVGRLLLSYILREAKQQRLNIAAAVDVSASVPKVLEEKLGFVEVYPARMLLDGKVSSVRPSRHFLRFFEELTIYQSTVLI